MESREYADYIAHEGDADYKMGTCESCERDVLDHLLLADVCPDCTGIYVKFDQEINEFVIRSRHSGREYFGQTADQAQANMEEDDEHWLRKRVAEQLRASVRSQHLE